MAASWFYGRNIWLLKLNNQNIYVFCVTKKIFQDLNYKLCRYYCNKITTLISMPTLNNLFSLTLCTWILTLNCTIIILTWIVLLPAREPNCALRIRIDCKFSTSKRSLFTVRYVTPNWWSLVACFRLVFGGKCADWI